MGKIFLKKKKGEFKVYEKTYLKKESYRFVIEVLFLVFLIIVPFASYFGVAHWKSYSFSDSVITVEPQGIIEGSAMHNPENPSESENDIPYITETRTVKEYRGGLGVYDCFGNLLASYETNLSVLTKEDRKNLREGIVFPSESETYEFIESFDS